MKKSEGIKVAKLCAKYVNVRTAVNRCTTNEQKMAVEKHFERQKRESKISVKEWIDGRLINRLEQIAKCLPDEGYSMGSYVKVFFSKLEGVDDRRQNYAKSCKYRPTWGIVYERLSIDEFKNIQCIGGIATYIKPGQRAKVKKCWWFSGKGSKQHFQLIRKNGYIFEGFHAETKAEALAGGLRKIEAKKQKEVSEKKYARALRMQYSYQDSIDAGNCEPGTLAFALRCGLSTEKKYRGAFLLKVAKEKSILSVSYVQRIIDYKSNRI